MQYRFHLWKQSKCHYLQYCPVEIYPGVEVCTIAHLKLLPQLFTHVTSRQQGESMKGVHITRYHK